MFIFDELKQIKTGKKELRQFGIIVGIVFSLIFGFYWWKGHFYLPLFSISAILILLGLLFPLLLKPVYKLWMGLAIVLGWFTSRLILIILFYLIVTPIGIITRLSGKDFLNLKFEKNNKIDSYWIPKTKKIVDKNDYEKQY